jgi:trimethylguanosine synthase
MQARTKSSGDTEESTTVPSIAKSKIDIIFLSPPWGGPSYLSASSPTKPPSSSSVSNGRNHNEDDAEPHAMFTLDMITPLPGNELFTLARNITPHIAYYLPRNTDVSQISRLVDESPSGSEKIEIEEEWMGTKLKALTCYFGGLVRGQEHMWTAN